MPTAGQVRVGGNFLEWLAELLPQGRLVEVEDSYTLIPLDQPARFAQVIREFTHALDRT